MSTVTMARPHVAMGPRSTTAFDRLTWRMVKAEFLKIRRRRGRIVRVVSDLKPPGENLHVALD